MAKRVLIVAGDAVEAQELFYPYWRLKEEGFEVHVAAPTKKVLMTVVHDFEPGWETYTEKPGYRFVWVDKEFKEVNPEDYDGLVIPGGRAPEYIRLNEDLERIVRHFMEKRKPLAAICHGPLILTGYKLIEPGMNVTSYAAVAPDLKAHGANWQDKEVVICRGHIVTARAWPDLPYWMREFIRILKEK
jgi:protease I